MTRRRMYLYGCPVCHRWSTMPTLEAQATARDRGACAACCRDQGWVLRVRIAAIEQHLAELLARGQALPLDEREPVRVVYRHKHAQLVEAQARLAAFLARQQEPVLEDQV